MKVIAVLVVVLLIGFGVVMNVWLGSHEKD